MLTNRPRFSIIYQEPGKRGARKKWLIVPARTDSRLVVQLAIIAAMARDAVCEWHWQATLQADKTRKQEWGHKVC